MNKTDLIAIVSEKSGISKSSDKGKDHDPRINGAYLQSRQSL